MEPSNFSKPLNRRQLIKKVGHVALGVTATFVALGSDYQKPTLTKLSPLKDAVALAASNVCPPNCN